MENSYRYFENRDCRYFPCHKKAAEDINCLAETPDCLAEGFNCLFCYCPMYHKKDCPGNPYYIDKNGKLLKVCTECTFPHRPGNYDIIVKILKGDSQEPNG